jgi:hypothetical protein
VGILWGGAIVIAGLVSGVSDQGGSYGAGQVTAFVFGIAFFLAGGRAVIMHVRR